VKLQKIFAYKYGDVSRYKYIITIPEEIVKQVGWKTGTELKATAKEEKLIIEFVANPSPKTRKLPEPKMTYDEFKDKIFNLLSYRDGLTWTEIKNELKLPQIVPNNKWVRQMEKDINLLRLRDPKGIVWKVSHVGTA